MKKKAFLFLALAIIFCGAMNAQVTDSRFNLDQLLESALQNNYLLQAHEQNTLISQAEIEILKTNYQPVISTSASLSYWKFLLPNKERLLGGSLTDMYTDITLYQTIYDWGENKVKKSVVEDEIQLNDVVRRQIRNTIIWGVSDAFFESFKARSEISVLQNSIDQLLSHLQYAENLFNIGKVSGVDVLKIKVQISTVEKALQKAENAHLKQLIKIKRLCYLGEDVDLSLVNTTDTLYGETQNRLLAHDSLYSSALQNHPVLLSSEQKIAIETKQKELYQLQNRPELYSYGIGSWEHGYMPFGNNFNYNIGVGIRYTIPYWGGSSFKTKMVQSDYRIEQMNYEKNQAFHDIKKEIDLALNDISDIRSEIVNNEKIIDLASETLNNAFVKYQSGQGNIIDVLDAQAILTETSISHKKSTIAYLQALAKLHYLSGNDTPPF